ncbi:hypothetical protein N2152v2_002540 [Parachlorella kessleri]
MVLVQVLVAFSFSALAFAAGFTAGGHPRSRRTRFVFPKRLKAPPLPLQRTASLPKQMGRIRLRCTLIQLLTLVPALGLLLLQASHPVAIGKRRRILLEVHDGQEDPGFIPQQQLPGSQAEGLSIAHLQGSQHQQLVLQQQGQQQPHPPRLDPQQQQHQSQGGISLWQQLKHVAGGSQPQAPGAPAPPQFLGYHPSAWEAEWAAGAEGIQEDPLAVCGTMLRQLARSRVWVNATSQGGRLRFTQEGGKLALDHDVFSRFTYRDPSDGEEYGVWIEPLVGHFRHPYNPAACVPPGMPPLPIQDRGYLLLHGLTPQQFQRLYPGKKYLLDLGTADFESSLGWFTEQYASWGVQFDEIWAWEVENQPPQEYWSHVPAGILPHLHFYNIPVTIDETHADNPFNIIKAVYQPGDFVVVKLDIDNVALESQLIDQIRGDPVAKSMIAEMHFEMHYDHADMALAFGHPNATWIEVKQLFTELRSSGLRLHYWP